MDPILFNGDGINRLLSTLERSTGRRRDGVEGAGVEVHPQTAQLYLRTTQVWLQLARAKRTAYGK